MDPNIRDEVEGEGDHGNPSPQGCLRILEVVFPAAKDPEARDWIRP